ncbi:hypothetical protein [Desulforhabdus sp. TSK]|uniref:hypothetical protein n=1 Tax=Desulforhabdus sp. TSK TaxID=2925014 RepID=UPI001FC817A8|nr:hypothetical protein [Desulforhabdus sp. TSK]GKT08489.1 hypothetical protein DSTSK_17940 [Desulforhabdus sp. TSK]
MAERQDTQEIRLSISDEVRAVLEKRKILESDIQKVVEFAERTGTKLLNQRTGRFLAHHNPAVTVTYWVEYTPVEGEFVIHKAYSHRMEVI